MKLSVKKIFGMKIASVVLLALLALFGFNFVKEWQRSRLLDKEIKKLELQAKEIEAENLDILKLAQYIDTEEFLEQEARTKLGLQKPGEKVVVVALPGDGEIGDGSEDAPEEKQFNPYLWWKHFFDK